MKDYKNRTREKPTLANINLQGPCNYKCYFCLGKDISYGECHNYLNTHFNNWKNSQNYLDKYKQTKIKNYLVK